MLLEWAKRGELSGAVLSQDGTVLTLHDERLDATQKVSLHHEGRSCEYTLASIFLQIVEPNQSLMAYRNKCKTHGVTDMVRATDKKTVVGYYSSGGASAPAGDHGFGQQPPPPPLKQPPPPMSVETTTVPPHMDTAAGDATKKPRPSSSSSSSRREKSSRHDDRKRDKHHKHRKHDKRSSSKDHKRRKSSSLQQQPQPPPTKKKKTAMTTAQMLSNLNVVVDKRRQLGQGDNAEINAALSAEGFGGVTPELLQEGGEDPAVHQSIVSYEIPVGNSASILRPAPGRDFERVLDLWMETTEGGGGKHHSNKSKLAAAAAKKAKARVHLVGKKPVIVLPKGMTSPLTMVNAYEFFNNRKFVPRDVAMKQQQQLKSSKTVMFWHKFDARRGSSLVEFELMDNPRAKLGNDPREWDRIVAVVALGAAWQFKDWPRGYNHPVDLFSRCFGFYVGLEGTKLPTAIEGWAVQRGKLNRDKRGLDSVCFATFWEGLEDRMVTKKPELIPQQQAE